MKGVSDFYVVENRTIGTEIAGSATSLLALGFSSLWCLGSCFMSILCFLSLQKKNGERIGQSGGLLVAFASLRGSLFFL